jgi:hypothetical protein
MAQGDASRAFDNQYRSLPERARLAIMWARRHTTRRHDPGWHEGSQRVADRDAVVGAARTIA